MSNKLVAKKDLLGLNVYNLMPDYLKDKKYRFTKVIEEYNEKSNIDNIKQKSIDSDLEEKDIK